MEFLDVVSVGVGALSRSGADQYLAVSPQVNRGLLLLGGREAAKKGGTEGLRETFWKWWILLLSLKLPWLGG